MGGDGNGGTAARATLPAEPQYVSVKTSVWWDIENCQVPKGCDPHAIAQNISSALAKLYYSGPVSISAYGDTNRIPASVQQALSSTGIALNHVPAGTDRTFLNPNFPKKKESFPIGGSFCDCFSCCTSRSLFF